MNSRATKTSELFEVEINHDRWETFDSKASECIELQEREDIRAGTDHSDCIVIFCIIPWKKGERTPSGNLKVTMAVFGLTPSRSCKSRLFATIKISVAQVCIKGGRHLTLVPDGQKSSEQAREPWQLKHLNHNLMSHRSDLCQMCGGKLIVKLSSTWSRHSVQIFITLQTPPLHGFSWTHSLCTGTVTPFSCSTHAVPRAAIPFNTVSGRCQPTIVSVPSLTLGSIIRSRPSRRIIETTSTPTDRARSMHIVASCNGVGTSGPARWRLDHMISESSRKGGESWWRRKAWRKGCHHGHWRKVETPWCSSGSTMVIHRKMAVAVCIRARRRYMWGIEDVGIDEDKLKIF